LILLLDPAGLVIDCSKNRQMVAKFAYLDSLMGCHYSIQEGYSAALVLDLSLACSCLEVMIEVQRLNLELQG